MSKLPWMKFFPANFDQDMAPHTLEIRGAWITIINHLWTTNPRGRANHSLEQWSRVLGVDCNASKRVLTYLQTEQIADCNVECNGNVTVVSRRIEREEKERETTRLRVDRFRKKTECNGNVTDAVTDMKRQCNRERIEDRSKKIDKEEYKGLAPSDKKHRSKPPVVFSEYCQIAERKIKEFIESENSNLKIAFPALILEQEAAKAIAWLRTNPTKRKQNIPKFMTNWLSRNQDRPRINFNLPKNQDKLYGK